MGIVVHLPKRRDSLGSWTRSRAVAQRARIAAGICANNRAALIAARVCGRLRSNKPSGTSTVKPVQRGGSEAIL